MRAFALCLIFMSFSLVAAASTTDRKVLDYNGQDTLGAQLFTEKTHTEYRQEPRQSTCSRQVFAGYRRICESRPQTICHRGPRGGRRCRTIFRQFCFDQPIYRTEYYPCTIIVNVPYQVFDYDTNGLVSINFQGDLVSDDIQREAQFICEMSSTGDMSYSFSGVLKTLAFYNEQTQRSGGGQHFEVKSLVNVKFEAADDYFAALRGPVLREKASSRYLEFSVFRTQKAQYFTLDLKVKRFLKTYFKGEVPSHALSAEDNGEYTVVRVDLEKLGLELKSGNKYRFEISLGVNLPGPVLNPGIVPMKRLEKEVKLELD